MTHLIIRETSPEAKLMLEYLKKMKWVEIVGKETLNFTTKKAINDARKGKVTKAKNVNDLIKQLNS